MEAPLAFEPTSLTAKAGTTATIEYLNDSNLPHNIQIFAGPDASASMIAGTEIESGPGNKQTATFEVPAEPGAYFFHCEVHQAQMKGTFEVTP